MSEGDALKEPLHFAEPAGFLMHAIPVHEVIQVTPNDLDSLAAAATEEAASMTWWSSLLMTSATTFLGWFGSGLTVQDYRSPYFFAFVLVTGLVGAVFLAKWLRKDRGSVARKVAEIRAKASRPVPMGVAKPS